MKDDPRNPSNDIRYSVPPMNHFFLIKSFFAILVNVKKKKIRSPKTIDSSFLNKLNSFPCGIIYRSMSIETLESMIFRNYFFLFFLKRLKIITTRTVSYDDNASQIEQISLCSLSVQMYVHKLLRYYTNNIPDPIACISMFISKLYFTTRACACI